MAKNGGNESANANDGFGDIAIIDPGSIDGGAADDGNDTPGSVADGGGTGEPARKRRRRRTRDEIERDGGNAGTERSAPPRRETQTQVKANIDTTTAVLLSIHQMLAGIAQRPEILINEDQAKALATAAAHVQSFYPSKANAKALAWANLAMIAGAVYGPKVVAIMQSQKEGARSHGLQAA